MTAVAMVPPGSGTRRGELALRVDLDPPCGDAIRGPASSSSRRRSRRCEVAPERPAPAGREPAVGEERNRQREEDDQPHPGARRGKKDGDAAERQPVVAVPVAENGVLRSIVRCGDCEGQQQQDRADRVPRLAPCDECPDDPERNHEYGDEAALAPEGRESHGGQDRQQRRDAQHARHARRGQPRQAGRGLRRILDLAFCWDPANLDSARPESVTAEPEKPSLC